LTRGAKAAVSRLDAAIALSTAMATQPCPSPLYRGMRLRLASAHATVHVFKAYTSTSPLLTRALLYSGGCVLRLWPHADTKWLYSHNEEEVLLARGTRWRELKRQTVAVDADARHPREPLVSYKDYIAHKFARGVTLIDLQQI
jgi:hypothetical protein